MPNVLTKLPETIIDIDYNDYDYDNTDEGDWFCIKIHNVDVCSCCGTTSPYVHVPGFVVVWPSDEDKMILKVFNKSAQLGQGPKILPYEQSMGKCISFYKLPR